MPNRIKEFRLNFGYKTQISCVNEFNAFLLKKDHKKINKSTFSRWENSQNLPTKEMWQLLADFFKTTPIVLQGAIGLEEVIRIIQQDYIDEHNGQKHKSFLLNSTTSYLAGIGKIDSKNSILPKSTAQDFEFWRKHFSNIFMGGQPIIWLITTKPVNLDLFSAEVLISSAMDQLIDFTYSDSEIFKDRLNKFTEYLDSQPIRRRDRKEDNKKDQISKNGYNEFIGYYQMLEVRYPNPKERRKVIQDNLKTFEKFTKIKKHPFN